MALSRCLSLIAVALLVCSVTAQSPMQSLASSPKKSPPSTPTPLSSPPKVSASPPSKTPAARAPSPPTIESPSSTSLSPETDSLSNFGSPVVAPAPAKNNAVLKLNSRFGAAGIIAIGLLIMVTIV